MPPRPRPPTTPHNGVHGRDLHGTRAAHGAALTALNAWQAVRFAPARDGSSVTTPPEPIDAQFGHARPGEAMGREHLANWMSSTKPLAMVAIAQLDERGLLTVDDRVSKFLPAFGCKGKHRILVRHLLQEHLDGYETEGDAADGGRARDGVPSTARSAGDTEAAVEAATRLVAFEVELLRALVARLGVTLTTVT